MFINYSYGDTPNSNEHNAQRVKRINIHEVNNVLKIDHVTSVSCEPAT